MSKSEEREIRKNYHKEWTRLEDLVKKNSKEWRRLKAAVGDKMERQRQQKRRG